MLQCAWVTGASESPSGDDDHQFNVDVVVHNTMPSQRASTSCTCATVTLPGRRLREDQMSVQTKTAGTKLTWLRNQVALGPCSVCNSSSQVLPPDSDHAVSLDADQGDEAESMSGFDCPSPSLNLESETEAAEPTATTSASAHETTPSAEQSGTAEATQHSASFTVRLLQTLRVQQPFHL